MGFLVVCVIIFLGSLVAGAVPFFLNLGERHVNLLSGFGAGMLVSTALAVILPEGVEAFHNAGEELGDPTLTPLLDQCLHVVGIIKVVPLRTLWACGE